MPIVNLASSLGQAGDAVAPITAQVNANMGFMLQLAQLQDQREARRVTLQQREREFASQLGAQQFTQEARLREEQRAARLDDAQVERMAADREFRERAFASETSLKLRDADRLGELADAQIAASESATSAAMTRQRLSEQGLASKTRDALGGRYSVSADGVLGILTELARFDEENGTSHAQEADALLHQVTGGDYLEMAPATLTAKLQGDPRLPQAFTAIGETLYGVKRQRRAQELGRDVSAAYGALARRVEALGNPQMLEELNQSVSLLVPQESDDSFLDYGDSGRFGKDIAAWRERVGLEESKGAARGSLKGLQGRIEDWSATVGMTTRTKAEVLGETIGKIEQAETPAEVRSALMEARAMLEPGAAELFEFGMARGMAANGGGRTSIPASPKFTGAASADPKALELARGVMDRLGMERVPAQGTPEYWRFASELGAARAEAEQVRREGVLMDPTRNPFSAEAYDPSSAGFLGVRDEQ